MTDLQEIDDFEQENETQQIGSEQKALLADFDALSEQYKNKANVIAKLIALLSKSQNRESQNQETQEEMQREQSKSKNNKKVGGKVNQKKQKLDASIATYIESFDNADTPNKILNWGVDTICNCDTQTLQKLKLYFSSNKMIGALAGLENAASIVAKLDELKNSFDLKKLFNLLGDYDFLEPRILAIIGEWTNTNYIEITRADREIIKKIAKVFNDRITKNNEIARLSNEKINKNTEIAKIEIIRNEITRNRSNLMSIDEIFSNSRVTNEISDWMAASSNGTSFSPTRFKAIIEGSYYKKIFSIKGNIVAANYATIEQCATEKIKDKSNMVKFLTVDTVINQLGNHFKTMIKPTELQESLYDLLNSRGKFAVCIDSAPGSGKSTGMLTNKDGIVVFVPPNVKSYNEMIISLSCAHVPFVMAEKDNVGILRYISSYETMGKLDDYDIDNDCQDYETKYPQTLIEMHRRLVLLEKRDHHDVTKRNAILRQREINNLKKTKPPGTPLSREEMNKIEKNANWRARKFLPKKVFFSSKIKFVVCHPNLRISGAVKVYTDSVALANSTGRNYIKDSISYDCVTVVIDDFGANGEGMLQEHDVTRLCLGANRIILSSGTCPENMGNPNSVLNKERAKKGKAIFEHRKFIKTLGLGIELNYKTTDFAEQRYSLFLSDKETFERTPTAFQTIAMADTFEFLKEKHQNSLRNFLLSNILNVTLDDLRYDIYQWIYSLSNDMRINLVTEVINRAKIIEKPDNKYQTLYLDNNPIECARINAGSLRNSISTLDGQSLKYIDGLKYKLANHEKELKLQQKQIDSIAKAKSRPDEGMTTEDAIRNIQSMGSTDLNLSGLGIVPIFDKKFVEEQLYSNINELLIMYLLQKGALVASSDADQNWIENCIKKAVPYLYGLPERLGVGVDMPKLVKVYLAEGTNPAITKQNIGRVGRSSQGKQGSVVFPNLQSVEAIFQQDVGSYLAPIFANAVRDTLLEYERIRVQKNFRTLMQQIQSIQQIKTTKHFI